MKNISLLKAKRLSYPDGGGLYKIDGKIMKVHCDEYHAHSFKCLTVVQEIAYETELDKAALRYAKEMSSAPDKETPDWIMIDFKAGALWAMTEQAKKLFDERFKKDPTIKKRIKYKRALKKP